MARPADSARRLAHRTTSEPLEQRSKSSKIPTAHNKLWAIRILAIANRHGIQQAGNLNTVVVRNRATHWLTWIF